MSGRTARGRLAGLRVLEWPLVWSLTLVGLGLGVRGFLIYYATTGESRSLLDCAYSTLQLFVLESGGLGGFLPWQLEVARFLLPAVAIYTAGMAFTVLFRDQLQRLRLALLRHHAIVCGGGRKGLRLVREFRERGMPVAVVERDQSRPELDGCREAGALVVIGDATDVEVLRRVGVVRARFLLAMCGDDGVNAEIAVRASQLVDNEPRSRLTCIVHLLESRLWRLLEERHFGRGSSALRLEFFNLFDRGARALLREHHPFEVDSRRDDGTAHVTVIGAGRFGTSVVAGVARLWKRADTHGNLVISVLDREAEARVASIRAAFPGIESSCRLVPVRVEVGAAGFERGDFLAQLDELPPPVVVYVCFGEETLSMTAGLLLRRLLRGRSVKIVVRLEEESGLASLLGTEEVSAPRLTAFALLDRACTYEMSSSGATEELARALHADYLENRLADGRRIGETKSLVPWAQLAESLRDSNRSHALSVRAMLGGMGYDVVPLRSWDETPREWTEGELEEMAKREHVRWMTDLMADGWRAGRAKDPSTKRHPDLVPWEDLDEATREIDREFVRSLPRLLAEAGYAVEPLRQSPVTSSG